MRAHRSFRSHEPLLVVNACHVSCGLMPCYLLSSSDHLVIFHVAITIGIQTADYHFKQFRGRIWTVEGLDDGDGHAALTSGVSAGRHTVRRCEPKKKSNLQMLALAAIRPWWANMYVVGLKLLKPDCNHPLCCEPSIETLTIHGEH